MEYQNLPKELDDSQFEFTLAEIVEMDNILKDTGDQTLGQEFFQDVALHFSCSPWRAGKSSVTTEQVQGWFVNRQNELRSSSKKAPPRPPPPSSPPPPPPPPPPKLLLYHSDSSFLTDAPSAEPPDSIPEFKGKASDLSELAFEAFSSRDNAWYDVASFLSYRVNCHGELDARVRYAGFGKDEDEWVNVARGVRDRSIPLESSECYRVKVGDLVLCYREGQDHALYLTHMLWRFRGGCTISGVADAYSWYGTTMITMRKKCIWGDYAAGLQRTTTQTPLNVHEVPKSTVLSEEVHLEGFVALFAYAAESYEELSELFTFHGSVSPPCPFLV